MGGAGGYPAGMRELDITDSVRRLAQSARQRGASRLLVVVSASSCPGCDEWARQLALPEVARLLGQQSEVLRVDAGDLYEDPAGRVRVGHWTLESPGFPTTWIFALDADGALAFCSLILGPTTSGIPEADLSAALAGTSCWPDEAASVRVTVCAGPVCLPLREATGFRADFRIKLPTA